MDMFDNPTAGVCEIMDMFDKPYSGACEIMDMFDNPTAEHVKLWTCLITLQQSM